MATAAPGCPLTAAPGRLEVHFADGRQEHLFCHLDPVRCSLRMRVMEKTPDGKVNAGSETVLFLADIKDPELIGRNVRLHNSDGTLAVTLVLDSPSKAEGWRSGIAGVRRVHTGPCLRNNSSPEQGDGPDNREEANAWHLARSTEIRRLQEIIKSQEESVCDLEESNSKTTKQLLAIQARLEESLRILQAGQVTYAAQAQTIGEQQLKIEGLKAKVSQPILAPPAGFATQPCAPSDAGSTRAQAPSDSCDASEDSHVDPICHEADTDAETEAEDSVNACADLTRRADELQRLIESIADRGFTEQSSSSASRQTAENWYQEVLSMAPQIMSQLRNLSEEKDRLEADLRADQAHLRETLEALQTERTRRGIAPTAPTAE